MIIQADCAVSEFKFIRLCGKFVGFLSSFVDRIPLSGITPLKSQSAPLASRDCKRLTNYTIAQRLLI